MFPSLGDVGSGISGATATMIEAPFNLVGISDTTVANGAISACGFLPVCSTTHHYLEADASKAGVNWLELGVIGVVDVATLGKGKIAREGVEQVGKRVVPYGTGYTVKGYEKHHVFQDAALRVVPGYSRSKAPAVHLKGKSTQKGSQHYLVTKVQREMPVGGNLLPREQ
jgi:hypothetical protein